MVGCIARWFRFGGLLMAGALGGLAADPTLEAVVEVEEEVYRYEPAANGAGPMWCAGSTCVVRRGETVYATGLETLPGVQPLNNCRWVLWRRDPEGWRRLYVDERGRTREPSPLAILGEGTLWVSANPTLVAEGRAGGGPARPEIASFNLGRVVGPPEMVRPVWDGEPPFTEHSYRSLAADSVAGTAVLFQNIDYTHAEWAFRAGDGKWSAKGRLVWPWGDGYAKPQPVRVCYPNVGVRGNAVHFFGVSDIAEPNPEWRAFKKELTGRDWDYDFRRVFYTGSDDVTRQPFRDWTEISSRDRTGGWLWPCDLWIGPKGTVHLMWTERAIDERLRNRFFPEAEQSHALMLATMEGGKRVGGGTLMISTEKKPGPVVTAARFHPMPDGRLFVVTHVTGDPAGVRNRLTELRSDGTLGESVPLRFRHEFTSFFTATPRAGTAVSEYLDLFGTQAGKPETLSYARIRVGSRRG